jgi:hypothetical protein
MDAHLLYFFASISQHSQNKYIISMLFYYFLAGRSAKENLLFTEVTEGMNSYGVTRHRHGKFSLLDVIGFMPFQVLQTPA